AVGTIAHLCDGAGLNGFQLAVQTRMSTENLDCLKLDKTSQTILTEEDHVKEAMQRSHILYDKAGEEDYNCKSAIHKSMRGSDENACLYMLGCMLEGGEVPLYAARGLLRFASEDVRMAEPMALTQAGSAFQASHFIGMPECEVIHVYLLFYFMICFYYNNP
ncbi:WRIP1 ATPase, partial [Polyodon spathula]|nr:WRIP1 ATPase [Polyodon spathula]